MLDQITPVILTGNEEANIARTLGQLRWAPEIVIVDSASRDRTVEIARSFPNVRLFERRFDDFASQWTFAAEQARSTWILALDADFFVPDALVAELRQLQPPETLDGYVGHFTYAILGRPLRASLYPPKLVLMRRDRAYFTSDGHTHVPCVRGASGNLRTHVIHDDRKSFDHFLRRQGRYMREEADKLLSEDPGDLTLADHIRMLLLGPIAVVVYTLFVKRCIFDGWAGLYYVLERAIAETALAAELLRRKLVPKENIQEAARSREVRAPQKPNAER
jgi:glycosyltransferase involved in cell wall biosynthesis